MKRSRYLVALAVGAVTTSLVPDAGAQLKSLDQAPNAINEGIRKSYVEQIGSGRGNNMTQNSSIYIIQRDPFRAIRRGRQIFQKKFLLQNGLGDERRSGGNIATNPFIGAGVADSCAACHGRPRGSAGHGGDVFTRPDSRDAPHLFGLGLQEMLADEITGDLRELRAQTLADARAAQAPRTRALVSKGIGYGSITANPNGTFNTSGVVGVNADLRVRPFFAQGGTISIREFLVGAFKAEMGMEAVDPDLVGAAVNRQRVVTPSGMVLDGSLDTIEAPPLVHNDPIQLARMDGDGDSKTNEIPTSIVDYEEFYLLHYFKAATLDQGTDETATGRALFGQIGCANCHMPTLTINRDRRIADVETTFNPSQGNPFNRLFATASAFLVPVDDPAPDPVIKTFAGNPAFAQTRSLAPRSFVVRNFYADLKRHDLGPNFWERNFDGTLQRQFMTEPLWGVASTAPYGHDGRSGTLEEVILRHGGEAQGARDMFAGLTRAQKLTVYEFLQTLVLFPPDDVASNLNPINPSAPNYPQSGHGSIALTVLFNNPSDLE